jgi:putative Ca2+/H+ antiporter (TMEM165/GDT1 family)
MDYTAALSAFALLFLAEMGDKTQLMAMTLAHRYRAAPVIAGTFLAFVVLDLLAVLLGGGLASLVPRQLILLVAGLLFLLFAWRSWRGADEEEPGVDESGHRRAFVTSFSLIFVAELGDKTQLALIALAAKLGSIWSVFVGGTLALWAVSLIGILVGGTLLRRIPKVWVHRAAASLFAAFGVLALGQAAYALG